MDSQKVIEIRKTAASSLAQPVVRLLAKTGVTPNTVTVIGFLLTLVAAALVGAGYLLGGGLMVLVSGFFDMLDGALARTTNQVTKFGGVLDSTLDRISDAVLLLGIILYALTSGVNPVVTVILASITMIGSFLISYLRAKTEALGMYGEKGLFTRPERILVLALGLLLNQIIIILAVSAVLSFVTVGQRLYYVWQQTRD